MLYLCRWPNGDVSFVAGDSDAEIDDRLDEVGAPGAVERIPIRGAFAVHFKLKENAGKAQGTSELLEFEKLDERTGYDTLNTAYPLLRDAFEALFDKREVDIEAALQAERERVKEPAIEALNNSELESVREAMNLAEKKSTVN